MKSSAFIAILFYACEIVYCENIQVIQTFTNVQKLVSQIQSDANIISHPDPEFELLQMFKPVVAKIEELQVFDIDDTIRQIGNDSEFVLNPVMKFSIATNQIKNFYATFEDFVNQKVYVDEVKIDEWLNGHNAKVHLETLHEVIAPQNRSDSLPYKLYLTLWYQVILLTHHIFKLILNCVYFTGWKTFMFTWPISASSHLQSLQCHRFDGNQRVRDDPIFLHDYATLWPRKFHHRYLFSGHF